MGGGQQTGLLCNLGHGMQRLQGGVWNVAVVEFHFLTTHSSHGMAEVETRPLLSVRDYHVTSVSSVFFPKRPDLVRGSS